MKFLTVAVPALALANMAFADESENNTTTLSDSTHTPGRFNKTKESVEPTPTGTHTPGRFNKTRPSGEPTASAANKNVSVNAGSSNHAKISITLGLSSLMIASSLILL